MDKGFTLKQDELMPADKVEMYKAGWFAVKVLQEIRSDQKRAQEVGNTPVCIALDVVIMRTFWSVRNAAGPKEIEVPAGEGLYTGQFLASGMTSREIQYPPWLAEVTAPYDIKGSVLGIREDILIGRARAEAAGNQPLCIALDIVLDWIRRAELVDAPPEEWLKARAYEAYLASVFLTSGRDDCM